MPAHGNRAFGLTQGVESPNMWNGWGDVSRKTPSDIPPELR